MSASEKLYKGYLRRNMPTIVSKVKVREIVVHLPCLTDHDRETIEAKRETCGNYDGMMVLLDCLRRRENWLEQFIQALEACEHLTIAANLREEFNALGGTDDSSPSASPSPSPSPGSPPMTVIKAHVHPAPSASHLPIPENRADTQAVSPADAVSPAPEPAAQDSVPLDTPVEAEAPQSSDAEVPVSLPEPVAEPPQSTQTDEATGPSTPPPTPEILKAMTTPPPQREVEFHQEPVENSESDIQENPVDNDVIDDQVSEKDGEVLVDCVSTPPPSSPDVLETRTTTEDNPPQSPPPTQISTDVTDGSSPPATTPEESPVQDTTPPLIATYTAVLQPGEMFEPATEVVESGPEGEIAATLPFPEPAAAGIDASPSDDDAVCLNTAIPISLVEPCSVKSELLEMSKAAPNAAPNAVTTVNAASGLQCQENGISLNYNKPEENHPESSQGAAVQEVLVKTSEQPTIPNLDFQGTTPQIQINGEATKEFSSAAALSSKASDTVSDVNSLSSDNHRPSDPAPAETSTEPKAVQVSEVKTPSRAMPANTKYVVAAGVGACALLMAWRFKH